MKADIIQGEYGPYFLARCCNHAYETADTLEELYSGENSPWTFKKENFFEDRNTNTQGFIIYAQETGEVIIAFRGGQEVADYIRGILLRNLVKWKKTRVCKNYLIAWRSVRRKILRKLRKIFRLFQSRDKLKLYITGHSLGAGIATIAVVDTWIRLVSKTNYQLSAFTFGCPVVGDKAFAEMFKELLAHFTAKHYLDPKDPYVRWIDWYLTLPSKEPHYCKVDEQVLLSPGKGHTILNYINLLKPHSIKNL